MNTANLVSMGKIVGAFGISGFVKIKTSSNLENLNHYKKLYVTLNDITQLLTIDKSLVKNRVWLVLFKDTANRNTAEALIGATVALSREDFPQTDDNEYYWVDLIGLQVINQENITLGTVDNLIETGPNSVLVVKEDQKTRLIPFVGTYIINVDLQKQQILVDWGIDY